MSGRIVFLHEIPHVKGGSSSSMLELARRFASRREVLVIAQDAPVLREATLAAGVGFVGLPCPLWALGFARPLASLANLFRLQLAIRRHLRPGDTLVVNGILGEFVAGWGWLLAAYPRVYFVRGAVGESRLWRLMSLRGLRQVVALSGSVRDQFLRQFPAYRGGVTTIPNAIALPASAVRAPAPPPFRIGCVGFIDPLKNQALAVRALAMLRARGVDATLELFGDTSGGADEAYLAEVRRLVAELGVGDRVAFRGFQPREAIYGSLHALVSPSLSEGFGKTIAEAMAHGLPAVALASAGGPRDIITDPGEGILLGHDTPEALAEALALLAADDGLRARMGARARDSVARRFAPEVVAARALAVIDQASA